MKKFLYTIIISCMILGGLHAMERETRGLLPIDIMSTGGAGIAAYDKFGMVFMNPAAFGLSNQKIAILEAGALVNSDTVLYFISNTNGTFSYDITGMAPIVGLSGPVRLGYVGNQFAALLYSDAWMSAAVRRDAGLPFLDFNFTVDFGFIGGYGFQVMLPQGLSGSLFAGINLKFLSRIKIDEPYLTLFDILAISANLPSLLGTYGFYSGQALGSDIGLLWKNGGFCAALVVRDWFSTVFGYRHYTATNTADFLSGIMTAVPSSLGYVPSVFWPSLDIGMSYRLQDLLVRYLFEDITVYIDIADSLNFSENYLLKLRLGAEVALFAILKVRLGLYKGYPTAGLSLDIPGFRLHAVYAFEELGLYPGAVPQERLLINLQIII